MKGTCKEVELKSGRQIHFAPQVPQEKCKDSVVESGVCGSVSEFDIAGTGAVYIKAHGGTLGFSSPTLGLTIRVEGRRQRCYKQN